MIQGRTKNRKKAASVLSIILILSIILGISPAIPQAIAQSDQDITVDQDTTTDQADGLEYQTISSSTKKKKNEIVTLDGLMPVNAEVNVQTSREYSQDNLFAYDISITDRHGDEFQPLSNDPIKVEITNSMISDAQRANQKLRLWHIDNDGLRKEIKDFKVEGDKIIFEASSFSVYEVDNGTPALRTYKFMMPSNPQDNSGYSAYYFPTSSQNDDGTYKEVCSQTIKNGENLIFPQLPADIDSKYTFIGWYVGGNDVTGQMFDFNNIPAVTQTETVELYAVFESVVYAIFHEQYNGRTQNFPVFATRRGRLVHNSVTSELEVTFELDDLKVIYDEEGKEEGAPPSMQFVGWTSQPIQDFTTGVTATKLPSPYTFVVDEHSNDKSIRLYPIFEPIRWLEFDSNGTGATYIPPKSFPKDQGYTFDDSIPVRAGYVFDGWYTEQTGGVRITDGHQNLVSNVNTDKLQAINGQLFIKEPNLQVKLYAHWIPGNSKYTVVIWMQKESDDKNATVKTYDFAESETIDTGVMTEDVVSVANTYKNKDYTGFYYSRCDASQTVAGNGSTVLNVYYDRCTVVYRFLSSNNNNASTLDTWTGLYGQKITKYNYSWDSSNAWKYKNGDQNGISYLEAFNSITSQYSAYDSASHTYTTVIYKSGTNSNVHIYHVLQDLNGNYDINNSELVYDTRVPQSSVSSSFNFTNKFEGFTVYGYSHGSFTPSPSNNAAVPGSVNINNQNLYVYHKRRSHTLEFVDSVTMQVYATETVLYQAPIRPYKPADPTTPPTPGYEFTDWYSNKACSSNTVVNFSNTIMPNANMIVYAGWDTIWFRIEIDPNGGELSSTQSTFFWEPYNGDPIEEYVNVSRHYEADVNGSYYYAKHDRNYYGLGDNWESREDTITDRRAYYTTDMSQATSATRYREATGAYRYLGWYEVDQDTGEEMPYLFGEPVMHDTLLRLHWKQLGTYHIKYDAGEGTIDGADQNEMTFEFLDADDYADHADVVVTRVARPVDGKNFVGWRMKNDPSGRVYYPGQSFLFSSEFAEAITQVNNQTGAVEVKQTIIMEAVYEEIRTAKIIYDANGGTINDPTAAALPANAGGQVMVSPVSDPQYYSHISVKYGVSGAQLTVSDLLNNSAVKLSNGQGFYNHGYTFLGWSTQRDGTDAFYDKDSITTINRWVDNSEPIILYAQWEVKVYFDRNDVGAPANTYYWGDGTGDDWANDNKYTYDASKGMYYTMIKLNGKVDRPVYTPTSSDQEEMFSNWSLEKQDVSGVMKPVFDFSTTGITQDMIDTQHNGGDYLILHACWKAPIRIPVYYVDTSKEEWYRKDDWRKTGDGSNIVLRDSTHVSLANRTDADSYALSNVTDAYEYAFAAEQGKGNDDYKNITGIDRITEIWYDIDEMCVKAKYSDNRIHEFDALNDAVYLIYYKSPEYIPIGYDLMKTDGTLSSVNSVHANSLNASAPTIADVVLHPQYNLPDHITQPVEWTKWGNGTNDRYHYYSFAIGKENAASSADLKVITGYKETDGDRPALQVRNNWNGFEYSYDGNNWYSIGYDIALYAVYYEWLPTIINLREETIALPDKMGTEFAYQITVTQTESKTVTRTYYYRRNNGAYTQINNSQYPSSTTPYSDTTTVTTITDVMLSDGQSDSYVLFYSSPANTTTGYEEYLVNGVHQTYTSGSRTYYVYYRDSITDQVISQTVTFTQTQDNDFSTSNDAVSGDQVYNSDYTSTSTGDPVTITYTNRQKLEKSVNVAVSNGDELTAHNEMRTSDTTIYQHDFTNSAVWNVSDTAVISPAALINNNSNYIFTGIITGAEQNGEVTPDQTNITSLNFGEITPGIYGYYLNGDTTKFLNDQEIWFVYSQKPTIRYWYEKPDGTFEPITTFTRNNAAFSRTGIANDEIVPVESDGLLIDQISTPGRPAFLVPGDLDYQGDELCLDLNRLSVGNSSGITDDSDSESMQIVIADGKMQYIFHSGDTPRPFEDNAVIYAVYKLKGYELTLTKQVLGESEGVNNFTFEIYSTQLIHSSYETTSGPVTTSGNTITLTVQKGQSVTIYGLSSGQYTIRETTAGNYEMMAKVNGSDAIVTNNNVAAIVNDNTTVEVLNLYPIPVTSAGENTTPYVVVVMILMAAVILFICRRKGEKQHERYSL